MVRGSKTLPGALEGEPPEDDALDEAPVVGVAVTVFVAGAGAGLSEHAASPAKAAQHRTTVATARLLKLLHPHRM